MTTTGSAPRKKNQTPRLDNLTLARKEGWFAFVDAPVPDQPELLTPQRLTALSPEARADYDKRRRVWHANLGPIRTPQYNAVYEQLWDILDSNQQTGDKAKGAIAIDTPAGMGKTTVAQGFAKDFQRRIIAEEGRTTDAGHERIPVCRVGMTGSTGMVEFSRAMLAFYAHPGTGSGRAKAFSDRALDLMISCETRLLIIDEMHFLHWGNQQGVAISNQCKSIANDFPLTLLFIGIGLGERGLYSEGMSPKDAIIAQMGRRTTRLGIEPFQIKNEQGRKQWRSLLLALEQKLVLTHTRPGMVADELSDYLFARTTGHIGSLVSLINRGCQRAVRTGAEQLNRELLDAVAIDEAAEAGREELEAALDSGKLKSRPRRAQ
ncbi:hypothetical protein ABIA30_004801 [Mycobacterium sp. MAA66]|uniref:TniB family NTP-binding protein n=1 Tax=Mycobacterium sp. MAA66 TaxID=3156297 RepID=UPI003513D0EC